MVPPVLVELQQPLHLGIELVDGGIRGFLGGWIVLGVGRGLGRVELGPGVAQPLLAFLGRDLGRRRLLEDRVLLELLLHQGLQLQHRRLQQRQRLLELRRQHHLL